MAKKTDPSMELTAALAAGEEPRVVELLCTALGAEMGRALSKNAALVDGKIAAFVMHGRMVVKLPEARRAALLAAKTAQPMRMGTRVMKEWVSIDPSLSSEWIAIARESAAFVKSEPRPRKVR